MLMYLHAQQSSSSCYLNANSGQCMRIPWINAPSEGLKVDLLLTQANVLACYHMAGHKEIAVGWM